MPTTVNLLDFENMVKEFMTKRARDRYPNLDTADGSVFDDMYVKPMQTTIQPLIASLHSMEIKMNLNNADYMEEDELEDVIVGNYMLPRKAGQKSVATVTLSFAIVSSTDNLIVPAGVTFSTSAGLKFENTDRKSFTPQEMYAMYNPNSLNYEVTIPVQAMGVGTEYNVAENQITKSDVQFNSSLVGVANKVAASGGTDKETNAEYAKRAKEYYISRHLGTDYGFKQFILENFVEIQDVYVAGYGDDFMTRDVYKVYDPVTNLPVPVHMGGKVDIYIKGSNLATTSSTVTVNSNNLFLQTDHDSIVSNSFVIKNKTDETKVVTFTTKKDTDTGKCVVTLSAGSFDASALSSIEVYYRYTNGSGTQIDMLEIFNVGITQAELKQPFKDIVDIQDAATKTSYSDSKYYTVVKSGILGTSKEVVLFTLNSDTTAVIPNGHVLEIQYSINSTVNALNEVFNFEENRVVTTDILFKEADPVYVNVGFKVKLKDNQTLDDFKKNSIKNAIAEFFLQAPLGQQIQESDIVAWVYEDTNIKTFLDFIALPFDSFYVTTNISEDIQIKRDATYLNATKIQYPVLNKISISAM